MQFLRRLFIYAFFFAAAGAVAVLFFFDDILWLAIWEYDPWIRPAFAEVFLLGGLIAVWVIWRIIRQMDREDAELKHPVEKSRAKK